MKLLKWMKSRMSRIGETSGDRVNEAIENAERIELGFAPQRKAWLVGNDGEEIYHVLNVQQDGKPHGEVTIKSIGDGWGTRVYAYSREENGFLLYNEV